MSSYAVVQTGGKQYRVSPGDVIDVEKLDGDVGARVDLADVLLVDEDGSVSVGTPTVDGAKVTAEVADQFRGPKIIVYKYKAKTRYRRKNGHRQSYTRLRIRHILTGGADEPVEPEAAPAPRRRRRSTRAAAQAEAPAAEAAAEETVAAAEEAPAEEPVAEAPEAVEASVESTEAEVATEEAPAEEAEATEAVEAAEAEASVEEAPAEESSEGEEKKA